MMNGQLHRRQFPAVQAVLAGLLLAAGCTLPEEDQYVVLEPGPGGKSDGYVTTTLHLSRANHWGEWVHLGCNEWFRCDVRLNANARDEHGLSLPGDDPRYSATVQILWEYEGEYPYKARYDLYEQGVGGPETNIWIPVFDRSEEGEISVEGSSLRFHSEDPKRVYELRWSYWPLDVPDELRVDLLISAEWW